MALTFRYAVPPLQTNTIELFSETSALNINKLTRSILAPFFLITEGERIPNVVAPGGTRTSSECFSSSYSGTILTLTNGYSVMKQELIEFTTSTILDVTDRSIYFDSLSVQSSTSTGKVYAVIYYDPAESTGYKQSQSLTDKNAAYIGLISDPVTYWNNMGVYCFLYSITVSLSGSTITGITAVAYSDPDISYMKRRVPDFSNPN